MLKLFDSLLLHFVQRQLSKAIRNKPLLGAEVAWCSGRTAGSQGTRKILVSRQKPSEQRQGLGQGAARLPRQPPAGFDGWRSASSRETRSAMLCCRPSFGLNPD